MDYYNIANLHHQVNGGLWSKTTLICCKIADLLNHKPQTKTRYILSAYQTTDTQTKYSYHE